MDEQALRKHLKKGGRSPSAVERVVGWSARFVSFLDASDISSDNAACEHLDSFIQQLEVAGENVKTALWALIHYLDFIDNQPVARCARKLRAGRIKRRVPRLTLFPGIPGSVLETLEAVGIRTTEQMLDAGKTPELRRALAGRTDVSESCITDLVKLSDLSRVSGTKGIRARLYLESGFDTLDKLARCNPNTLREALIRFVEESGFDGIAPWLKEAAFIIENARKLPRLVEY